MRNITIALCHENLNLVKQLEQDLNPLGIRFTIISNEQKSVPGEFATRIADSPEPVLFLLTDNLLKNDRCMPGLLASVRHLVQQNKIIPVIADGYSTNPQTGETEAVHTQIDRMADALNYMNHWQNLYLDAITEQQRLPENARGQLDSRIQQLQTISGEVGELISTLRDTLYFSWAQFTGNDYKLLFQQFDMLDLHSAFISSRNIPTPQHPEPAPTTPPDQESPQTPPDAEQTPHTLPPPPAGPIAFRPVEETPMPPAQPAAPQTPTETHTPEAPHQEPVSQNPGDVNSRVNHILSLVHEAGEIDEAEKQLQELHSLGIPEELSHDLMGEIALGKGDFLFAKYCWDRVLQIDESYPDIHRKLGLLTSEHLPFYKETAVHYLKTALEKSPRDAEIMFRLGALMQQLQQPDAAARYFQDGLDLAPEHPLADLAREALGISPQTEPEPDVEEEVQAPEPESIPQNPETILTVMITGATSGIGKATAELFARNGHRLILTGRRTERLDALKTSFEANFNSQVLLMPFDVRDIKAVQYMINQIPEDWRDIDLLINNAGLAKGLAPIHEGELEHWETMIDTNIKGLLYMTRAIAPLMVSRHHGHIINVGSSAGKEVYPNGNVYCATKFAVDALTRSMRLDLFKHGIRVSQVSPGHVENTEFALTRFDGNEEKSRIYEDFQPLEAHDVAEVIYFIATRPAHVNIQDVWMYSSQQASSTLIDRSGRTPT